MTMSDFAHLSPTRLLTHRSVAYVRQSGRDAQFSTVYGRMYQLPSLSFFISLTLGEGEWKIPLAAYRVFAREQLAPSSICRVNSHASNASDSTEANTQSGNEYGLTIIQHFHNAENPKTKTKTRCSSQ